MSGKLKVQPVSRVGIAPLIDIAEHLRAAFPGWRDLAPQSGRNRELSDFARDFDHLTRFDGDGFLTVSADTEVLGFATGYVRSRLLVIPQLWLLADELHDQAAELLFRRLLGFGERAGVRDCVSHVLGGADDHALCFRFGLRPRMPIYRMQLPAATASLVGMELAKLLPGADVSSDLVAKHTGASEIERLDRLVRGMSRPADHEYWQGARNLRLATVRDGQHVAGYAYGGAGQCGPVVASTREGLLAGLGWALQFAATADRPVEVLIPAAAESAIEHLLDAGADCLAASYWFSRVVPAGLDRYVLPSVTLI